MPTDVEEIKTKLNIVDLISKYIPLKKRGRHFVACCPFHHEKTPSFTVSPELQIFKCFGCGKSGDIFSFVQEFDRLSFSEALEDLAKLAGIKLTVNPAITQKEALKKQLYQINQVVANFYHYILTSHPLGKPAFDYVLQRGITLETVKTFKIGFSPPNSELIIRYLSKKQVPVSGLIATGTFGQSRYGARLYDRFSDRLVFPLTDYRGHILGFSGRILPNSPKQNLAKYINSPETDIYHKSHTLFGINLAKDSIRTQNSVIITEGEFDMISPFQQGIKNIVAIKGTAFTPDQLQLLRRYTDTLILALDSDFAGNHAAIRSIDLAESLEFDIKVLTLGDDYKDPDEACQKNPEFFKNQLANAVPVWDFLIESSIKSNGVDTVKGKKTILATVLPSLAKIQNSVIRHDYLHRLSQLIGSDYDSVLSESRKYPSFSTSSVSHPSSSLLSPPSSVSAAPSAEEKIEEYLLSLIIAARNPLVLLSQVTEHYSFITPRFKTIVQTLLTLKHFDPSSFRRLLPAEVQPIFDSIYLDSQREVLDSISRSREVSKSLTQLRINDIKSRINQLSRQIALTESSPASSSSELEKEYTRLLGELQKLQSKKA